MPAGTNLQTNYLIDPRPLLPGYGKFPLLNIDDRLRLIEGKSTNELEIKGKIQNLSDRKDVLTSKKSNETSI